MNRSRNPQPRQLNRIPVVLAALVAGGAFLYMVKLMDTMTGHMATIASRIVSMSTELETMRAHMGQLTGEVSDIAARFTPCPPWRRTCIACVRGWSSSPGSCSGVATRCSVWSN